MRRALALLAFLAIPLAAGGATMTSACTILGGDCGQCNELVECVERCGAPIVQSGCCACPEGTRSKQELRCVTPPVEAGVDSAPPFPDCSKAACIRAVMCVVSCGGPVVQSGCCPCPAGTFDDFACRDAGGDARDGAPGLDASDASSGADAAEGG